MMKTEKEIESHLDLIKQKIFPKDNESQGYKAGFIQGLKWVLNK